MEEVHIWNGKTTWFVEISTWKAAILSEQTFLTERARSADEEFDITLYTLSAHISLRDKSENSYPGESRVKREMSRGQFFELETKAQNSFLFNPFSAHDQVLVRLRTVFKLHRTLLRSVCFVKSTDMRDCGTVKPGLSRI